MVASDYGIAVQLAYLKQLIHGYNARELRARRVHLIWQVRDIGESLNSIISVKKKHLTTRDVTLAAQPLLNSALNEDTLDDGWVCIMIFIKFQVSNSGAQILAISIYCESINIHNKSFGKRANVYRGKAPLRDIFQAELGEQTEIPVKNLDWETETLVEEKKVESGEPIKRDGKMLVTGK